MLETFNTIALAIFNAIGAVISWLWNTILMPVLNEWWAFMTNILIPAIQLLGTIFGVVFQIIAVVVQIAWTILSVIFQMIVGILVAVLFPVVQQAAQVFTSVWQQIAQVVQWAWNNVIKPVWGAIIDFWNTGLKPIFLLIGQIWKDVWNGLAQAVQDVWPPVKSAVTSGVNGVIDVINGLIDGAQRGINDLISAYNKLPGVSNISPVSFPHIGRLHSGGMVTPLFGDESLAILRAGEGVVNQRGMTSLGTTGLNELNNGTSSGSGDFTMNVQPGAIQIKVDSNDPDLTKKIQDAVADALTQVYNQLRAKNAA
jgi:prepilin signal peptidase PulO-like enzyme (type II secretory pathway)